MRDLFPGAIYLGQELKFTAPIMINNNVTATVTVEDIREDKKIVTFQTIVKNEDTDKIAITGEGTFIIPQLKVRIILFNFRQERLRQGLKQSKTKLLRLKKNYQLEKVLINMNRLQRELKKF